LPQEIIGGGGSKGCLSQDITGGGGSKGCLPQEIIGDSKRNQPPAKAVNWEKGRIGLN
jgi:hypothetical protein